MSSPIEEGEPRLYCGGIPTALLGHDEKEGTNCGGPLRLLEGELDEDGDNKADEFEQWSLLVYRTPPGTPMVSDLSINTVLFGYCRNRNKCGFHSIRTV